MGIKFINKGYDVEAECNECHDIAVVKEVEDEDDGCVASALAVEYDWIVVGPCCFCDNCKDKPEVKQWCEGWSPENRRLFGLTSDGRMVPPQ